MSHGCVNMTEAAAEHVYYFAQTGTEVSVHS
jgi:lipoprotein-anchoring transpeptidase ErfK/SrfK